MVRRQRASWTVSCNLALLGQIAYAIGITRDSSLPAPKVRQSQVWKRFGNQVGFAVIARRWVVERFFAWINRNRRLAKDFEATIESVEAFFYAASVQPAITLLIKTRGFQVLTLIQKNRT